MARKRRHDYDSDSDVCLRCGTTLHEAVEKNRPWCTGHRRQVRINKIMRANRVATR